MVLAFALLSHNVLVANEFEGSPIFSGPSGALYTFFDPKSPAGLRTTCDPIWGNSGRVSLANVLPAPTASEPVGTHWFARLSFQEADKRTYSALSLKQSAGLSLGPVKLGGGSLNFGTTADELQHRKHLHIHVWGYVEFKPSAVSILNRPLRRSPAFLQEHGSFFISAVYPTAGIVVDLDLGEASGIVDTTFQVNGSLGATVPLGDSGLTLDANIDGSFYRALKNKDYNFTASLTSQTWGNLPEATTKKIAAAFPNGVQVTADEVASSLSKFQDAFLNLDLKQTLGAVGPNAMGQRVVEITPTFKLTKGRAEDEDFESILMQSYQEALILKAVVKGLTRPEFNAYLCWPDETSALVDTFRSTVSQRLASVTAGMRSVYAGTYTGRLRSQATEAAARLHEQCGTMESRIVPSLAANWLAVDAKGSVRKGFDERSARTILTLKAKNCAFKACTMIIGNPQDYNDWGNRETTKAIDAYAARTTFPVRLALAQVPQEGAFKLESSRNLNVYMLGPGMPVRFELTGKDGRQYVFFDTVRFSNGAALTDAVSTFVRDTSPVIRSGAKSRALITHRKL